MIGSKEAETMEYLTYKRTFWARMLAWWERYALDHPERASFNEERLLNAGRWVQYWNGRAHP